MSALYAKQVEWKKGASQRAKDGSVDPSNDLTFQPVFYTSKDTSRKFKVTEKVGALTGTPVPVPVPVPVHGTCSL